MSQAKRKTEKNIPLITHTDFVLLQAVNSQLFFNLCLIAMPKKKQFTLRHKGSGISFNLTNNIQGLIRSNCFVFFRFIIFVCFFICFFILQFTMIVATFFSSAAQNPTVFGVQSYVEVCGYISVCKKYVLMK